MKTLISTIVSCQACFGLSAAAFQNLDFNSVRQPLAPVFVPIGRALPGWNAYIGTIVQSEILYESSNLGTAGLELRSIVPGKDYALVFYSGGTLLPGSIPAGPFPTGIYQTGDVPVTAKTLLFQGNTFSTQPNLDYRVSLDGVSLSLQPVTEGTFGADVSAFAGKTAELRFQANYRADRQFPQVYFPLDNIRFSPDVLVTVPEPSTWALLGVGGAFLLMVARSRKA